MQVHTSLFQTTTFPDMELHAQEHGVSAANPNIQDTAHHHMSALQFQEDTVKINCVQCIRTYGNTQK